MRSYLAYSSITTGLFPDSYGAARQSFQDCIARSFSKSLHKVFPCTSKTPDGNPLFTDSLWIGNEDAGNILVLLAGTHGVEGFVGTAIVLDHLHLLSIGELVIPADTAILIIHALTPWGYAWLRRCDEDGVDLNRNGVDFSEPLPVNFGYELLRSAIFSTDSEPRKLAFNRYELQHGRLALEIAMSGGQYTDPTGPFYGGNKPAHGRMVTEELIRHHALHQRNLAVIDIHSGLGSYGYGEIICDHKLDSPGQHVAQQWYGDAVTLPALGTSSSVPKIGLMDYIWHAAMNDRSCHVTLEFGTYPTDHLFFVLLRDHQLWAQDNNIAARLTHSKVMRQHFCPNDDVWKAMTLFRGRQVIAQALQGLPN